MHEELFHSPERPFRATPDARFYFPYESVETARQTAVRAVLRAEGPVMVLGGAGLGKSLLGLVVAQELASRFDIVQLHAARLCSRRALLQNILFELQLPYRDLSEGDLRLSILTRLEPSSNYAPEGVLMIVDEADTLPAKLLDELRLINNFTRCNQPRTRLVLIGNLRLEHTFAEPQMESFNQRLAARCYLQPMNRQQTCDYIVHQLTVAGLKPSQMITTQAMHTVYAACDGVPRLTNQLMDHALAVGITRSQCPVSPALVEEAWADLQQLPAPWHAGADGSPADRPVDATNSVEFGALEDDGAWTAESNPAIVSRENPETTPSPNFFAAFTPTEEIAAEEAAEGAEESVEKTPLLAVSSESDTIRIQQACYEPDSKSEPVDEATRKLQLTSQTCGNFQAAEETENGDGQQQPKFDHCADAKDPLVRPRVLFDADEALAFTKGQTSVAAALDCRGATACDMRPNQSVNPIETQDSFFCDRPTDERLLALEAEQLEYDSMGVWENDPPLAPRVTQADKLDSPLSHNSPATSQLFGDDFEVEESLNGNSTWIAPQIATAARHAAEAADHVSRIQQFADAFNATQVAPWGEQPPSVDELLLQPSAIGQDMTGEHADFTGPANWTLDVASLDSAREAAVHEEIEDMVSQLNFAAFSVEPFSVEQIPLESTGQRPHAPQDFSRSGPNDEIYTMHRPLEALPTAEERRREDLFDASADDDRDLLVIEEELPPAVKTAGEMDSSITKIAPYSQLFAKLRK